MLFTRCCLFVAELIFMSSEWCHLVSLTTKTQTKSRVFSSDQSRSLNEDSNPIFSRPPLTFMIGRLSHDNPNPPPFVCRRFTSIPCCVGARRSVVLLSRRSARCYDSTQSRPTGWGSQRAGTQVAGEDTAPALTHAGTQLTTTTKRRRRRRPTARRARGVIAMVCLGLLGK